MQKTQKRTKTSADPTAKRTKKIADAAVKADALARMRAGETPASVARFYGLTHSTVNTWRARDKGPKGDAPAKESATAAPTSQTAEQTQAAQSAPTMPTGTGTAPGLESGLAPRPLLEVQSAPATAAAAESTRASSRGHTLRDDALGVLSFLRGMADRAALPESVVVRAALHLGAARLRHDPGLLLSAAELFKASSPAAG